ncbi:acylneuraminate cytidylyltransferase family protein [candidate division KSB1 bacterium]|nr:acylneuraminate cytidylyltransferase family protein [candidate division KSB1 bacterium]
MISNRQVIGIVPARSGSKGVPNKNIKILGGIPLMAHPILALKGCSYIDKIIVSTNCQEYADIAMNFNAEVPFLRPAELARDNSPSFGLIEHIIKSLKLKMQTYIIFAEPTSPFTESIDFEKALVYLDCSRKIADSIVGVSKSVANHPYFCSSKNKDGILIPFLKENFDSIRRQDISEVYFYDGSLYISDVKSLLDNKGFHCKRTLGFVSPRWKSIEIDDEFDWLLAELLFEKIDILKRDYND